MPHRVIVTEKSSDEGKQKGRHNKKYFLEQDTLDVSVTASRFIGLPLRATPQIINTNAEPSLGNG